MLTQGCYATVWDIKPYDKSCDLRITTSRKGKDGKYVTDFNGYVRVLNSKDNQDAVEKALKLKPRDRIHILSFGVQNTYNKEKNTNYWNIIVFDFEEAGELPAKKEEGPAQEAATNGSNDDLPF